MKNRKMLHFLAVAFAFALCFTTVSERASAAARPTFTIKNRKKKSVTIKIKKKGKVTGYKIYISNSKKGKYRQVGVAMMSMTYKLTGLKQNKSYYVKIRSYRTRGTRIKNGAFSKPVKIPKYKKKTPVKPTPKPTRTPVPEESAEPSTFPEESAEPSMLPGESVEPSATPE